MAALPVFASYLVRYWRWRWLLRRNGDPVPFALGLCGYLAGFADGYAIGDFLSEKVGVKLNAFCLPKTPDLSSRLVRAVLGGFDRVPPNTGVNTATLVASSLSRSFPCADSLEPKK